MTKKISELPLITTPDGTELIPVVKNGVNGAINPVASKAVGALATQLDVLSKGSNASSPPILQNAKGVLFVECADSTGWQAQAVGGSVTAYNELSQNGAILEGNVGFALLASSGWTLTDYVANGPTSGFVGPTTGNADWNLSYVKINTASAIAVSLDDTITFISSRPANEKIVLNLSLGINDCILRPAIGNLSQNDLIEYITTRLRTAVNKLHAARPSMLIVLRTPNPLFSRVAGAYITDANYPTFSTDATYAAGLVNKWNTALRSSYQKVAFEQSYTLLWDVYNTTFGSPDPTVDTTTSWNFYSDNVHPNTTAYYNRFLDFAQLVFGRRAEPFGGRIALARNQAATGGLAVESYYARYAEGNPNLYELIYFGKLSGAGSNYIDLGGPNSVGVGTGNSYNDIWIPALRGRTTIIVQIGDNVAQKFTSFSAGASGTQVVRLSAITPSAAVQASPVGVPIKVWAPKSVSTGSVFLDGERQSTKYRATYEANISAAGSSTTALRITLSAIKAGMFKKDQLVNLTGIKLVVASNSTTYDLSTANFSSTGTPVLSGNTIQIDLAHSLGVDFSTLAGLALLAVDANADDPSAFTPTPKMINSSGTAVTIYKRLVNGVLRMTNSTAATITIPTVATGLWSIGDTVEIVRSGAGTVTLAGASGVTVNSAGGLLSVSAQYKRVWVRYTGTGEVWELYGDLA